MEDIENSENVGLSYRPNPTLISFMEEKLQREKAKRNPKSAAEESWDTKKIRNLDRRKVHVLNKHVFQAMANLTYFFETIVKNEELELEELEDDIEELLLGIPQKYYNKKLNNYTRYEDETVIGRFLIAILSWNSRKYPKSKRFLLFPIIQRAIGYTIMGIADDLLGTKMSNSIVLNDFGRAETLAEFLGKNVKIKTDMPDRPVKF